MIRRAYLAHNFAARFWLLKDVVPALAKKDIHVTSRWLVEETGSDEEATDEFKRQCALNDFEDIRRADFMLYFLDNFGNRPGLGKHVELGYALAKPTTYEYPIILIGEIPQGSVFFHHPGITDTFPSVESFLSGYPNHYYWAKEG